jgi:hypothetical protein
MDKYGNVKETWQELITIAGPRLRTVDIQQATRLGDARRLSNRYQDARRVFRSQAMDMRLLDQDLPSANPASRDPENPLTQYMDQADKAWVDVYQDLVQRMRNRITLGHGAAMVKGDFMSATPSLPKAVVNRAWIDAKSSTSLHDVKPPPLFTGKDMASIYKQRRDRAKERGLK